MISQARTNIFGNIIRTVQSGISAGVISPEAGCGAASASLARIQARTNSACSINSASMPWTCRCASILVEREHEFGLRQILRRGLVHDLRHRAGTLEQAVTHLRVAMDEDPLPRHQHI